MFKFLALFLLINFSCLIAQTSSIEAHNARLKEQGNINFDNVDQLMIQTYLFSEYYQPADLRNSDATDLSNRFAYGSVFALDQPDSINWYLCPIDFQTASNTVAFQYFYYCGDTLGLESFSREEAQLLDPKTGQQQVGQRNFFSKGKLYYSDNGNWVLSTHTSRVGEWGGSMMLAWQPDGENLSLKGISSVIPIHSFGTLVVEAILEVDDNALLVVGKTQGGDGGGGYKQPWVGLWRMPYQMEIVYSYLEKIVYK